MSTADSNQSGPPAAPEPPTDPGSPVEVEVDLELDLDEDTSQRAAGDRWVAMGVLACGLGAGLALARLRSEALGWVATLGEGMERASDFVGWVFLTGLVWVVLNTWTSWRSRGQLHGLLRQVRRSAKNGMTIDAAIARADTINASAIRAIRAGAGRAANFQVLLGMFLTAGWLALNAEDFQSVGAVLGGSATGEMADLVAGLLQLGPKAFVTTASALASAVVVTLLGLFNALLVRSRSPADEALINTWRAGNAAWIDSERGMQQVRTEELVAKAVSTQQVEVLQQSFKSSMQAVGALLGEVRASMSTLQDTAQVMGDSYEKLERVAAALETAQLNVTGVADSITTLTTSVEAYGVGLLQGTKDFTERLVQDTSTRIPEVVSHATRATVDAMTPHLTSLTDKMHGHLERSAEDIQKRYTRAFQDTLQKADQNLQRVNTMSAELETRASRLAQTVGETAESWARTTEAVDALHARLDVVSERSVGQMDRMVASQEAIDTAARATAGLVDQLAGLVREARSEVTSIRRDAEVLGQIREAVHQGGLR